MAWQTRVWKSRGCSGGLRVGIGGRKDRDTLRGGSSLNSNLGTQLQDLAETIIPHSKISERGSKLMGRIVEIISREFGTSQAHKGGSVGKKTAIFVKVDYDLYLFMDERKVSVEDYSRLTRRMHDTLKKEELHPEDQESTDKRFSLCVVTKLSDYQGSHI